jgi:hypothetical protein
MATRKRIRSVPEALVCSVVGGLLRIVQEVRYSQAQNFCFILMRDRFDVCGASPSLRKIPDRIQAVGSSRDSVIEAVSMIIHIIVLYDV